jgi:signal transduction histidine kinase
MHLAARGPAAAISASVRFTAESRRQAAEAAEAERARWARELHDAVLQELAGITLALDELGPDISDARRDLHKHAVRGAEAAIAAIRALVADLRPIALEQIGLEGALEELLLRYRALPDTPKLRLELDLDYERGRATERHRPELESALYRIAQEALSNAVRHSGADEIVIAVHEADAHVQVEISDDGQGFDRDAASPGVGLTSLHERAALLNGSARIISEPGAGTTVSVRLPVGPRAPTPAGGKKRLAPGAQSMTIACASA